MTEAQISTDAPNGAGDAPKPEVASQNSETASDFINSQLRLEADAREALPYNFDHCTQPLGPLRQSLFSCLTCNPPPKDPSEPFTPAGVCYSCSIACHGEHTLVELFNRRNFTCDCGTTRLPSTSPCTLRIDPATGMKGPIHSQMPSTGNTYNHNFKNRFCGCGELYNPHEEKGTMFQCLGLSTEAARGCGEDWWHPECLVGVGRRAPKSAGIEPNGTDGEEKHRESGEDDEDQPLPPDFPAEDDFETFICYKCVNANPWIKMYAGTKGFLPAVFKNDMSDIRTETVKDPSEESKLLPVEGVSEQPKSSSATPSSPRKRSADQAELESESTEAKRSRADNESVPSNPAYHASLPPAPAGTFSLFFKENFRDHFCRCRDCYPVLSKVPQLLEEEDTYEPPVSESGGEDGEGSAGTNSLLDRGEAALSNVDRVRAIEGVMVYNHLKDKVKTFLQPFAESGRTVGAEDIKAYFEKLRGDEQAIKEAGAVGGGQDGTGDGNNRKEQSGY